MIIIIEQTCKDGAGTFEAGNRHTVGISITIDVAERLIASGWAYPEGDQPPAPNAPADVTLDVQPVYVGQAADSVG